MGNRLIHESIRISRTVNEMTDFQFRLWTYLITFVDDYGRGSADPELIRGLVFPRRKGLTEEEIEDALQVLEGIGSIRLYKVDGEPYFCFPNWSKHQRIQSKRSKFPAPEDAEEDSDPDDAPSKVKEDSADDAKPSEDDADDAKPSEDDTDTVQPAETYGDSRQLNDTYEDSQQLTDTYGDLQHQNETHGDSRKVTVTHGDSRKVTVTHGDSPPEYNTNTNTNTNPNTNPKTNPNTNPNPPAGEGCVVGAGGEKKVYGEYKHVLLTDAEYAALKKEHSNLEEAIKFFDEYIECKAYQSANHYLTMNRWVFDAVAEDNQKKRSRRGMDGRFDAGAFPMDDLDSIL